jgi:hypothetical protein
MSSRPEDRTALFNEVMGHAGNTLDGLPEDIFDPSMGALVGGLKRVHAEAFLPNIVHGRVELTPEQAARNGAMVIPLLTENDVVRVPPESYDSTPRRIGTMAAELGVSAEKVVQLHRIMYGIQRRKQPVFTTMGKTDRIVDVGHMHDIAEPVDPDLRPIAFVGRSIIFLHPRIEEFSPEERSAEVLHAYTHVVDVEKEREPWPLGKELSYASYLALRGNHVGSRVLGHLGVSADTSEIATANNAIEALRLTHTDPREPFVPDDAIVAALGKAGLRLPFKRLVTPNGTVRTVFDQ